MEDYKGSGWQAGQIEKEADWHSGAGGESIGLPGLCGERHKE